MKKLLAIALILMVASASFAQKGKITVNGQLSVLNSVSLSGTGAANADGGFGFGAGAEYMLMDNIGIVADVLYIPVGTDWNSMAILAGGTYHYDPKVENLDTYAEVLLGMTSHTGDAAKDFDGGFSYGFGGGATYKFAEKLSGFAGYRYINMPVTYDYDFGFGVKGSYDWTMTSSQIYVGVTYQL
ncbi:MAG: outer membrane beta-barrel protein [Bacteroidetes bacterium]|nr:outer membrane beta-barrel protein [Bacteroidota bacterium]